MDSPLYVRMAESFAAGPHEPQPAHEGYPLLVAMASRVLPGRELPGRAVSLVASLALVWLVWTVARRRFAPALAFVPAAIVALHPLFAVYGTAIMTEATFLALAFAGVALLDARRMLAGGALLGAAWWVRPEAVVVAPLAVLATRAPWRGRALAVAAALVVALAHSAALRYAQGSWSLTPKTVLVHAAAPNARSAEWRLSDATALPDRTPVAARLRRDGPAILAAYPARLGASLQQVLRAWPIPMLLFTVLGLARLTGRGPWLAFAALPCVYPLLAAPADLRFAQLAVPAFLLAFVAGLEALRPNRRWALPLIAGLAFVGLALLWTGPAGRLALAFDDGPMDAMRGAGAWIAAHSAPNAVVMDRKSYVAFFAHRRHVQLPDEPLDRVLDYARASGADFIVVEEYVVRSLRPQLAPLLDQSALAHEPRVQMAFAIRPGPDAGIAVLAIRH